MTHTPSVPYHIEPSEISPGRWKIYIDGKYTGSTAGKSRALKLAKLWSKDRVSLRCADLRAAIKGEKNPGVTAPGSESAGK